MRKIEKIREYIKRGVQHYRNLKNPLVVEALQNVLTFIDSLDRREAGAKNPSFEGRSLSEFEGVIPTTFGDFTKEFYEGLVTGPVTIYIESCKESKRTSKTALEPVGHCQVGITGNLIHLRGQLQDPPAGYNEAILIKDSVGGPAIQIVKGDKSNIRYLV